MNAKRRPFQNALHTLFGGFLLTALLSCAPSPQPAPPAGKVPPREEALFEKGRRALAAGDRTQGERLLRTFLLRHPHNPLAPNASMFLGRIAFERADFTAALGWFSPYLGPNNPDLLRLRANQWTGAIQRSLGRLENAERYYRAALLLAETDADRLSTLRPLVRLAFDRNRSAEAVEHLYPLIPLLRSPDERRGLKQRTVEIIFRDLDLSDTGRLSRRVGRGFPAGFLAVRRAELLAAAGRPESARSLLRSFLIDAKGHLLAGRAKRLMKSLGGPAGRTLVQASVPVIPAEAPAPPNGRSAASGAADSGPKGAEGPKPAGRGTVLTVGILLSLSGENAGIGREGLRGVQLALQHAGSFADRVKLQVRDAGGAAGGGVEVKKLALNPVIVAILGPYTGPKVEAGAKAAQEIGIPLVLPAAPSGGARAGDPYVFRTGVSYALQAEAVAVHAAGKLGLRSLAILYPSNPSGIEMRGVFHRRVAALGGRIVREASYPPDATDFGRQIRALGGMDDEEVERIKKERKARGLKPARIPGIPFQGLFIPDRAAQVALIVPSLAFYNIRGIHLLGGGGWNSSEIVALARRDVEGAYFVGGYAQLRPTARGARFARDFQRAFAKAPTETAAYTYDAMRFLLSGLRSAGRTRPSAGGDRAALRAVLAATKDFDGVTGKFSIGPTGAAERRLPILTIVGGKIRPAGGPPSPN
ncbi:MAG: ABC transporter substrate-binding protein [Nitrospinota bacterium]|nr:ABC transporter substrate-binding protein [Nitrospinota bacterium]HJM42624.1 ABC transporter substrate-binding protein [Nitrospinota bacterium]